MLGKAPSETVRVSASLIVILLMAANFLVLIKDPRSLYWLVYYILLGILFYMINLSVWCPQYYAADRVNQQYRLKKLNQLVADRDPPPSYSSLRTGPGVAESVKDKSGKEGKTKGNTKLPPEANACPSGPSVVNTAPNESSKIKPNPSMKYGATEISEVHGAAGKPSATYSPHKLPKVTHASQNTPDVTHGEQGRSIVYGAEARPTMTDSYVDVHFEEDDLPSYQKAMAPSHNNDKLDPFHV